jgi:hypothetical protein
MSWAARYVGTPWIAGEAECWHRAAQVWREVFGWEVAALPAGDSARLALSLAADPASYAGWRAVEAPRDGDAVVMAQGARPCHVGVWAAPDRVLHWVRGAGGLLTPAPRLPELGYRIAGHYRRAGP